MDDSLTVLATDNLQTFVTADSTEQIMLKKASDLINLDYPEHSLLELWNASVHNLRRRIEMYSVDIFISTLSSLEGRKTFKKDGDTLSERWAGIDDAILIKGAIQIGVLDKKAGKALEMINWMRNHASPAHDSDNSVTKDDILGLVIILKHNLFDFPLPDPAHSPVALLTQIRNGALTENQIELFKEQIENFSNRDMKTIFGYAVNVICEGTQPEYDNIIKLFETIWKHTTEDLRQDMGMKMHSFMFDPSTDKSTDGCASERLYDALLNVSGVKYIPEGTRATIYRKLAKDLAFAKNCSYGWEQENAASRALLQVGIDVPSIAFEDVYQEILSVWCGNYWGRSNAHIILRPFIFNVQPKRQVTIARLFRENNRVRDELYQPRPKQNALDLLNEIKNGLTNDSQIAEMERIILDIQKI